MRQSAFLARILIIAGSDSGGGAGIQGDIKTVEALGGYSTTAITALTAQNTLGVSGVYPVPPEFVAAQMEAVLDDIGADALKTGMLFSSEIIDAVSTTIERKARGIPLVVDPVMVAKGGAPLLKPDAVKALKERLFSLAALITPNIPEAELLADMSIRTPEEMEEAALRIRASGAAAVLIKGGHLKGVELIDLLLTDAGIERFVSARIDSQQTHGTGCALASAIATGLGQKKQLKEAVRRAHDFVHAAILTAPHLGRGHGPLGHARALAQGA